jgi:hypothetical protein
MSYEYDGCRDEEVYNDRLSGEFLDRLEKVVRMSKYATRSHLKDAKISLLTKKRFIKNIVKVFGPRENWDRYQLSAYDLRLSILVSGIRYSRKVAACNKKIQFNLSKILYKERKF